MKNIYILISFLLLSSINISAQQNFIEKLLNDNKDLFGNVLSNLENHEVQIIYTQINRDKNNFPSFTTYKYQVDPKKYFYPASTVKLPAAILALEKLNNLKVKGLNKLTPLRIDSVRARQSFVTSDTSSENNLPSIANYVKKVFLVSDNDAYNRLYEFLGQEDFNTKLHQKGFKDVKILHRFVGGLSAEDNRYTNPITFYDGQKIIYSQPEKLNEKNFPLELNETIKGIGYWNAKDSLINKPFDFSAKNFVSLEALTEILKAVVFPETRKQKTRFNLTYDDYKFLLKYMSMLPHESKKPGYDSTYYDSYVKYFLFGDSKKPIPENIRIFNKVGLAYGYLTDVSYIVDFENKIEFMLSAVILVNKDQIFNDGVYEYDQVGLPFLSNLGKVIYNYEKTRLKIHQPNLSKFRFEY